MLFDNLGQSCLSEDNAWNITQVAGNKPMTRPNKLQPLQCIVPFQKQASKHDIHFLACWRSRHADHVRAKPHRRRPEAQLWVACGCLLGAFHDGVNLCLGVGRQALRWSGVGRVRVRVACSRCTAAGGLWLVQCWLRPKCTQRNMSCDTSRMLQLPEALFAGCVSPTLRATIPHMIIQLLQSLVPPYPPASARPRCPSRSRSYLHSCSG